MQISRSLRRMFGTGRPGSEAPFSLLQRNFAKTEQVVRIFYLTSIFIAYQAMGDVHLHGAGPIELEFVWPVAWMSGLPLAPVSDLLGLGTLVFALLAFWKPEKMAFRAGFTVFLLFCAGIRASYGGINHGFHAWLWVSACLVFLPAARSRAGKLSYCLAFATAQGLLLLFYSLAGFWKAAYGFQSMLHGVEGNFSPRGLALLLSDRMMQTGTQPLLGDFLVNHYLVSWPLFIILILVQLLAVIITFRPSLHVAWALILIAFHTGTFLLMEIPFPNHILALTVILLNSPFTPANWLRRETIYDVPGLGFLARLNVRPRMGPAMAAS